MSAYISINAISGDKMQPAVTVDKDASMYVMQPAKMVIMPYADSVVPDQPVHLTLSNRTATLLVKIE